MVIRLRPCMVMSTPLAPPPILWFPGNSNIYTSMFYRNTSRDRYSDTLRLHLRLARAYQGWGVTPTRASYQQLVVILFRLAFRAFSKEAYTSTYLRRLQ